MSNSAPHTIVPTQKKSKFGCLVGGLIGGMVVLALICAGIIGAGIFGVFAVIKSSQPYTDSLERVQRSAEVQKALGEPIDAGMMVSGNINLNNNDGEADLTYSVSGPEGSGSVHVVGKKTGGEWFYSQISVEIDGSSEVIDVGD